MNIRYSRKSESQSPRTNEKIITYLLEDTTAIKQINKNQKLARALKYKHEKLAIQSVKTKSIKEQVRIQELWDEIVDKSLVSHYEILENTRKSAITIQKYARGWLARMSFSNKLIGVKGLEILGHLTQLKYHSDICMLSLGVSAFSVFYI